MCRIGQRISPGSSPGSLICQVLFAASAYTGNANTAVGDLLMVSGWYALSRAGVKCEVRVCEVVKCEVRCEVSMQDDG